MGCNCKKTYNKLEKYSDNKINNNKGIINNILNLILQIGFGILIACLFIIIIIPIIVYITICLIIGKEPSIRIKHPKNYFRHNE